jgi:hypothetical protein
MIDTHELAWAAGFVDGEGCFAHRKQRVNKALLPSFHLAQVERYPLDRFNAATLNICKVYGPSPPKREGHSPYYQISVHGFEKTQAILAMLWKWLGPTKRAQGVSVLQASLPYLRERYALKGMCEAGLHYMTEDNVYTYTRKSDGAVMRHCIPCKAAKQRARRDREDDALKAALEAYSQD